MKNIVNIGAYVQQGGENSGIKNLGTLAGVYTTPAIHVDVTAVFTNTNPMRAYRGNGRPEAAFVIERLVDIAADEMGIDPAELRRRNTIPPQAMPFKTALDFNYDCGEFEKNHGHGARAGRLRRLRAAPRRRRTRGKLRGIGISNTIERAAVRRQRRRRDPFDRSGTVTIGSGSLNQGQGHETMFKQIVGDLSRPRPGRHALHPGRHRQGSRRRRHRRLALGDHWRGSDADGVGEDRRQGEPDRRADAGRRSRRMSTSRTGYSAPRRPTGR